MAAKTSGKTVTKDFYQKLSQLHFCNGTRWQALPPWALFYLELGAILGLCPANENARLALALAVPARDYVASLIAAGCILARAAICHPSDVPNQHIEWLRTLAPGTPVLVRENGRRLRGKFQRIITMPGGRTHYMVRIDSGANTTKGFQPDQIQPFEGEEIKLPNNQKGRARLGTAPLITKLLGETARAFSSYTYHDCALIGTKTEIRREIEEQYFAHSEGSREFLKGTLRDILRPKCFLPANSVYRSNVFPSSDKTKRAVVKTFSPHIVVFDGSPGYLNQRHAWQIGHMVFVLDQTEPQFEPAVTQVNQEYSRRSNQEPLNIRLPSVPAGVEAMLFEVKS